MVVYDFGKELNDEGEGQKNRSENRSYLFIKE
jgi:hypothetical protein